MDISNLKRITNRVYSGMSPKEITVGDQVQVFYMDGRKFFSVEATVKTKVGEDIFAGSESYLTVRLVIPDERFLEVDGGGDLVGDRVIRRAFWDRQMGRYMLIPYGGV